ncbi:uncharacterized protein LOC101759553 isoform X2 [Setaria italica]|uniref:uncharacterized protein LOC101759553 isoform X2 n=1 Tax=Setaria italica TaxID=4555 RepID=UPI000648DB26|nr:uncharacterized protein LOC101759553 isoform X2 [Setaria italica]
MNPFTKATMPLPSLSSYSYYEDPVEVAEDCMAQQGDMPLGTWSQNKYVEEISVLSLVVCSARLIAAIVAVGALGTIALCHSGATAWSVSAHEECRWLTHMVFFQGKLYALDSNTDREDLISIDIVDEHDNDEPRVSRIERLIEGDSRPWHQYFYRMHYLLESHDRLLMVRRKLSYMIVHRSGIGDHDIRVPVSSEFEVFKADFELGLWSDVSTLGNDQALFLRQGCSRAVRVSPYDLSRDCLFFIDDYTDWSWKKTTTSCGVYDMKDEKVRQMSCKQQGSIFGNLWMLKRRILLRFHVEELVLLVLLLLCRSARKGKRNLHAVMCSYRKKSYNGSQMCLDISSSELHENNAWTVGT